MKKVIFLLAAAACSAFGASAQLPILQGHISSSQVLSEPCYEMRGCVEVDSGATLTIPAGTKIFGDIASKAALIIKRGAKINAQGTPTNPIIFTSDTTAGNRRSGQWGGIVLCGRATNNQPGDTFQIEGTCFPIFAGGNDDHDSSGVMSYVQIHYAGVAASPNNEVNSLTFCSVGDRTVVNHIMVTYANDDAFEWFGGTVNAKYLIALSSRDDDFDTDFGFRGKIQFGFAWRQDTSQHDISTSNGFESDNLGSSPYLGTPKTKPVFSNMTVYGPLACGGYTTVNNEYGRGAHIRRNSACTIYNSVIAGWPLYGLYIDDSLTMVNTASDDLNFSYNNLSNNGSRGSIGNFGNNPATWRGCTTLGSTMSSWLNFGGTPPAAGCEEVRNSQTITPSYSFCSFDCNATSFALNDNNLGVTSFDDEGPLFGDDFFTPVSYRGAFSVNDDWTNDWTEWCPNEPTYEECESSQRITSNDKSKMSLVPNPSSGITHAVFNAPKGAVRLTLMDKVSGQVIRTINTELVSSGEQHVAFSVSGLQMGIYIVKVETSTGSFTQQLFVKQ